MFIPYKVRMTYVYAPVSNAAVIGITTAMYFLTTYKIIPESAVEAMVLQGWSLDGMVGCVLLHGGFFHLLGNMLFLWVFGNAINSVVGNIWYVPVYLFLGLCASATHLMFSDVPAIGASGAINGIVGMALVLFPRNKLDTIFLFAIFAGKLTVRLYAMVLFWFVFDLIGAVSGGGGIAYWAHVGGFISGVAMASILLAYNTAATFDLTIFDILSGKKEKEKGYISGEDDDYHDKLFEKVGALQTSLYPDMKELQYDPLTEQYTPVDEFGLPAELRDPDSAPVAAPLPTPPAASVAEPQPKEPDVAAPVQDEPAREYGALPAVSMRVLSVMKKSDQVTCFIVNEGEPLSELWVEHASAVSAEIYPVKVMKSKEPGWIKFGFVEGNVPPALSFILKCKDAGGNAVRGELVLHEETKRISGD